MPTSASVEALADEARLCAKRAADALELLDRVASNLVEAEDLYRRAVRIRDQAMDDLLEAAEPSERSQLIADIYRHLAEEREP